LLIVANGSKARSKPMVPGGLPQVTKNMRSSGPLPCPTGGCSRAAACRGTDPLSPWEWEQFWAIRDYLMPDP